MRPVTTYSRRQTIYSCERCGAKSAAVVETRSAGEDVARTEIPVAGLLIAAPFQLLADGKDISFGEGFYCDARCLTDSLGEFLKAHLQEDR